MIRYKIPKGTVIAYYDSLVDTWKSMSTHRTVYYIDEDEMVADSYLECVSKYGEKIADYLLKSIHPSGNWYANWGGQRRAHFRYFLVPDDSRPIIEVLVGDIIVEERADDT